VVIPGIKEPVVAPLISLATYKVIANVGKCFASDSIVIRAYPYPTVNAGLHDSICYGYPYQLKGTTSASTYYWSSASNILNGDSATLNPTVTLNATTTFILTAFNLQKYSCPKIEKDTVTIKVLPKVNINIGNDTSIVANQPLQLKIKGDFDTLTSTYLWTSIEGVAIGLNSDTIQNPVAILNTDYNAVYYIARATNTNGCFGMDTMKVVIYKTVPDLVIPNAFTPQEMQNRIAKPIPYGILELDYFTIYNRYGQLLYSTNKIGEGWDGTFKGINQPPGTYVFVAQARDYTGRVITKKGTLVLIR
jgi:gliding motility-associated-like protein